METFQILLMIGTSLFIGVCLGFVISLLLTQKSSKALHQELDKFRSLYFYELDKWKNKYTNDDDYEAY